MKTPVEVFKQTTYNSGEKAITSGQIARRDIPAHEVRRTGLRRWAANTLAGLAVAAAATGGGLAAKKAGETVPHITHDVAADVARRGEQFLIDVMTPSSEQIGQYEHAVKTGELNIPQHGATEVKQIQSGNEQQP